MVSNSLDEEFFNRDPDSVAKDLLGKILVRKIGGKEFRSLIVETEAYFGEEDPASRASKGKTKISEMMWEDPGKILVYNVHKYKMFNFITRSKSFPSGVLVRALEPLDFDGRTKGPGLLTETLRIDKGLHGKSILNNPDVWIEIPGVLRNFEIEDSFRVGVTKDLNNRYRFFIKGNKFVSRRKI